MSANWASWTPGYTCWVRYVLTLAISPPPQEKFWACDQPVSLILWREVNTRSLEVGYPLFDAKGYLLYTRYAIYLCIVFWYYPLFVAICEIWLLKLTYGAYLVLSLKSGITLGKAWSLPSVLSGTLGKAWSLPSVLAGTLSKAWFLGAQIGYFAECGCANTRQRH